MEQSHPGGIKTLLLPIVIVILMVISFFIGRISVTAPTNADALQQPIVQPTKSQTLNKSFSFPVKDQNNKVITQLSYKIESADLINQIIVKGQPATAIKGKTFLVINLRLDNPSSQTVVVNTRDYIRLTVNKNTEQLAPEVYNDPVEIQPISTKLTRLGFPINTTDKHLVLHIGEISGTKTDLPLSL